VLALCNDVSVVVKSLVLKDSEKKGGTLILKNPSFAPFVQFKNQAKFEVEFKSKVVDLVKMYNFGVLSF